MNAMARGELAAGAGRRDKDGVRTALIVRADDGTVGLRFLRSGGATAGPFEVTRLVPQGAAERSGAVEVGEYFRAVNGWDVTALDDAAVAGLFRGAPGTTLTLLLCDGPASLNKRASEHLASEANLKEIEELEGGEYGQKRSALHIASEKGLESAVAKLLSLGADAAFKDEVRACSLAHCLHTHYHVCQDAFRISLHALMHTHTHM
jgi:hypothetical protein